MTSKLDRFFHLTDAIRANRPRPDTQTAAFAAAALLHSEIEPAEAAQSVVGLHQNLKSALGWGRAPDGDMRWIYAALLTAQSVPMQRFLDIRTALREAQSTARAGALHGGGSRAALVLSMADKPGFDLVARFNDLRRALRPPWWRANAAVTDTFCAAHAMAGDTPTRIAAARERAVAVYKADRWARGHKYDGARMTVLMGDAPETVLARFRALEEARKADRFLRGRTTRGMAMDWAASGQSAADLPVIAEIVRSLPRSMDSVGYSRARLAHIIAFGDSAAHPAQSASAMAAVIAAQMAMMAAMVAAMTAATTTSASASSGSS